MFFKSIYMTASIPNSFNSDELEKLMDNAPHEADCQCGECPQSEGIFSDTGRLTLLSGINDIVNGGS